jgi:hypothetical protein
VLLHALSNFQLAKLQHSENVKGQYLDKTGQDGAKNYFRASEMGMSDRKIIYGFFRHQLPTVGKSAKNLRQLENGDYVHERYQKMFNDMGALISMEQRVTSKEDEYLKDYAWEYAGHYDAEVDDNILRAHALGFCTVGSVYNEETGTWDLEVTLDEKYAEEIGYYAEEYRPITRIIDIKSMNPWGFKRLKEKADISDIQGYIDQIMFYMYMKETPFGSIFIEDKGSQEVIEVQVVWVDMFDGVSYDFEGEQPEGVIRLKVYNARFFGDTENNIEGLIPRIDRLWTVVSELKLADADANDARIQELFPIRCCNEPQTFPCSWGKGKDKCEYFDHCWHSVHGGMAVKAYEACPDEDIWEFDDYNPQTDETMSVYIDSRKVPTGVTYEGFLALVEVGVLDYTKFLVDEDQSIPVKDAMEALENENIPGADNLFSGNGELNLGASEPPAEATEYLTENNERAIDCLACGKQIIYKKLAGSGIKPCPFCNHKNQVVKK